MRTYSLSVFELSEACARVRYISRREIFSKVARRQVKIAFRELVGSSFEHGINLAFPRLYANARFWSALRSSHRADGRVVVESRRVPNIIFQSAPLGASESKSARVFSPTPRGNEREILPRWHIIRKLWREVARSLYVARIAGYPGTAPL